jgi:hypothetical protein
MSSECFNCGMQLKSAAGYAKHFDSKRCKKRAGAKPPKRLAAYTLSAVAAEPWGTLSSAAGSIKGGDDGGKRKNP